MNDVDTKARDYRETVFLPRTPFPMRGDLPKREPVLLARWQSMRLSERLAAEAEGRTPFILHDGPPYANGHLHIGHALNKIHKDVINRAQRMAGRAVRYVPGWDCHGLPIEWKVEEEYRAAGRDKDAVPILQFRAECRAYAERWLLVQDAEFRRLGIEGEWADRYATMDFAAEAAIAAEIGRFLLNGLLYRGLRPVMWSTVEKTALAEAEIEYHDHVSTTIFARFPLVSGPLAATGAAVVIWTTTPWTIPGNRAVAFGEGIDYALVRVGATTEASAARPGERLLLAVPLLARVAAEAGITAYDVEQTVPGSALAGHVAAHPLRGWGYEHDVPLLAGAFVTADQGTGFVHVAPSHGEEDFALGIANGLEVPETVGPDGRYADWVPRWGGLHVFKAADPVCNALADAGGLLARGTISHAYPHSWRSRAPLIYRATPQWFIRLDGDGRLRQRALACLADVAFVPPQSRHRLESMLANRPDWCISRQRAWGVPIPVFVDRATGEVLRDPAVMDRIVETFRAEGADAWFASPPERFLGAAHDAARYEQVSDIVDVWFESGSTHAFVLEARGLPTPADIYLEGSDQHRGWFQSSLLEAVGSRGAAPFRTIVSDGFVLDEQGRKMSKSLGNGTAPQEVCDQYGADILRLWALSGDLREDLRIGPEILRQQAELYRRLRNTLRWLLGALDGFTRRRARRPRRAARARALRPAPHRRTRRDRRPRARHPRLGRRRPRDPRLLRRRPLGLLFRRPQGRPLLRQALEPDPARRPHRARPAASLPDRLARPDHSLHRRGCLDRPLRRGRQRAPHPHARDPGRVARRGAGRALAAAARRPPHHHHRTRERPPGRPLRLLARRPPDAAALGRRSRRVRRGRLGRARHCQPRRDRARARHRLDLRRPAAGRRRPSRPDRRTGLGRQVRPLLARPGRGRRPPHPPPALPALRRRRPRTLT